MAGLPHYKNARVNMEMWEPVYQNLFEVMLTPPAAVGGWDYVMDNVNKISGLDTDKTPGAVEQKYKGATRRFAAALPDSTVVDIAIDFSVNVDESKSMYVWRALREWCNLVWNPLTGAMMLKKDYTGGPMTVSLYNRVGDVVRQWVFPTVWPGSALNPMELDYDNGTTIYAASITFLSDYWEDIWR